MATFDRVLVLGSGYAGSAIARLAGQRGMRAVAHVRSDARAEVLRSEGLEVYQQAVLDESLATHIDGRTLVVVAFPPDGTTDARIAPLLERAAAITYISSTGVYGEHRGLVDDTTVVPPPTERIAKILAAEEVYLQRGGVIVRCPGIYGRDRGLHIRVIKGEHLIPGDGTRFLSRIHVEDLAQLVFALAGSAHKPDTFVVGDCEPARQIDVVRFIADAYGVPMPPFVPLESVHESLRADRRVDATRALGMLGAPRLRGDGTSRVPLRFPTYREGMAPEATGAETFRG